MHSYENVCVYYICMCMWERKRVWLGQKRRGEKALYPSFIHSPTYIPTYLSIHYHRRRRQRWELKLRLNQEDILYRVEKFDPRKKPTYTIHWKKKVRNKNKIWKKYIDSVNLTHRIDVCFHWNNDRVFIAGLLTSRQIKFGRIRLGWAIFDASTFVIITYPQKTKEKKIDRFWTIFRLKSPIALHEIWTLLHLSRFLLVLLNTYNLRRLSTWSNQFLFFLCERWGFFCYITHLTESELWMNKFTRYTCKNLHGTHIKMCKFSNSCIFCSERVNWFFGFIWFLWGILGGEAPQSIILA